MRELTVRVVTAAVADQLKRAPQNSKEWMVDSDETVRIGWAWHGVMFCLRRSKFVTDAVESRVVFGEHTLEKNGAEPRLVGNVSAIHAAFERFERSRIGTHLFAPDEWNEEEIEPSLRSPEFWKPEHLSELLEQWDRLAAAYRRAHERGDALLLWWS